MLILKLLICPVRLRARLISNDERQGCGI
jgi:hypothetical protein